MVATFFCVKLYDFVRNRIIFNRKNWRYFLILHVKLKNKRINAFAFLYVFHTKTYKN